LVCVFGVFFFVSFNWDVGGFRGVVGCLPVVVWFSWVSDSLIRFSLLVVVEVMFARNIGGDGSVTMVVMDHIWVCL